MEPRDRHLGVGISAVTAGTLIAGVIGFVQALYILRLLGAEHYGTAAVIVALGGVAANLVDFRVTDAVAREFYAWQGHPDERLARARALRVGLLAAVGTGLTIAAVTLMVGAGWFRLTGASDGGTSILIWAAASQGIYHVGSYLLYVLRLTTGWRVLAASQVLAGATNATVVIAAVVVDPSPVGYIRGMLGASACNTGFALAIAARSWSRAHLRVFSRPDRRIVFRSRWWNLAAAGGALGFSKLLHRSADTLLVAFFCDERQTGLYRFARSSTDALYMLFDASNKIVQPHLLRLLGGSHVEEIRRVIARSLAAGALFGIVVIGAEIAFLASLIAFVGSSYAGAEALVLVLTLPVVAVLSVHLWLWPMLLHHERAGEYAVISLVGVAAIQYAVPSLVVWQLEIAHALPFAVGYAMVYAWTLLLPVATGWADLRAYLGPRVPASDAAAVT